MNLVQEKILIRKLKKHDRAAAEKLIKHNYKKLFQFLIRRCGNKEVAEDLTQETFIKAWNSIDQFRNDCRFSTWLISIGYNKYLDLRKQNIIQTIDLDESQVAGKVEFFENNSAQKEMKILRAVGRLNESSKEIIMLHYKENLSYSEISTILGIPKGTVKSRVNTAINKIRTFIKEEE